MVITAKKKETSEYIFSPRADRGGDRFFCQVLLHETLHAHFVFARLLNWALSHGRHRWFREGKE